MSVPAGQQQPNRLEVFYKTENLAVYTIEITKNPKTFPPELNHALTDHIVDAAVSIHEKAWQANNILVKSAEDWEERNRLQNVMRVGRRI